MDYELIRPLTGCDPNASLNSRGWKVLPSKLHTQTLQQRFQSADGKDPVANSNEPILVNADFLCDCLNRLGWNHESVGGILRQGSLVLC